jgi:hypothetical protein
MDVEPPTGDDLNRMLVSMKQDVLRRAAAEPPARRRPWARRHLGLTLGLVALLGIGGAGGALALVLPSPFQASPAATPSSTPSATPSVRPTPTATAAPVEPAQPAVPSAALGIDCATLGERIGVTTAVPRGAPVPGVPQGNTPLDAAYDQVGALECTWATDGDAFEPSFLRVTVVPAGDRGREWISGLRDSGLADQGLGDLSAGACEGAESGCRTSVVVGPWWFESSGYVDYEATPDTFRPVLADLADELRSQTPGSAWRVPATSWDDTTCSDLPSTTRMSELLTGGAPTALTDTFGHYLPTGIFETQRQAVGCDWLAAPDADSTLPQGVTVTWAPGSGWALDSVSPRERSAVTVAGADAAWAACIEAEGNSCWIDVLVDDTWVQVRGAFGVTRENQDVLVPVAEAVLAAQAAASGRG